MQLARTFSSVGASEYRRRPVSLLHALQFLGDQIERLIPANTDEIAVTTALQIGAGAMFEKGAPHHWIFDAKILR